MISISVRCNLSFRGTCEQVFNSARDFLLQIFGHSHLIIIKSLVPIAPIYSAFQNLAMTQPIWKITCQKAHICICCVSYQSSYARIPVVAGPNRERLRVFLKPRQSRNNIGPVCFCPCRTKIVGLVAFSTQTFFSSPRLHFSRLTPHGNLVQLGKTRAKVFSWNQFKNRWKSLTST